MFIKRFIFFIISISNSFFAIGQNVVKSIPQNKNRIYLSLPFHTDRNIAMMLEYKPIYEREILNWLSVYAGPSFYGRKISASAEGTDPRGYSGFKIALLGGANPYFMDGWGQNYGIKIYNKNDVNNKARIGLNITYQQRNIRLYGPRALKNGKSWDNYSGSIVDKSIRDGRLRILLQQDLDYDFGNEIVSINFYAGAGYPLWGVFEDQIRHLSGDRKLEWSSGNNNNIIMMRHYDIYLGASFGFCF